MPMLTTISASRGESRDVIPGHEAREIGKHMTQVRTAHVGTRGALSALTERGHKGGFFGNT